MAIFDRDRAKVGEPIGPLTVRHNDELRAVVEEQGIVVGVLAVPGHAAQGLADDLVAAGVRIIFNYSEALLTVPPEVTVHTSNPAVDLLYALYFYLMRDRSRRCGGALFAAASDLTVGLEEEFAILEPQSAGPGAALRGAARQRGRALAGAARAHRR